MSPPIILVLFAGLAIAGYFVNRETLRRRAEKARALAAAYGFAVDTTSKKPPELGFDHFGIGSSRRVQYQFWRPDRSDSVFQYQYTTGSGKDRTTHYSTCALVALPFRAPHTKIGPEGFFSKLGRAVGWRDIEVESPEFNDVYRVTGDDERFAVTLLDQAMIGWMLHPQSGRGTVRFELRGPWLLCISSKLEFEEMLGYHDWALNFSRYMPAVLTSLYPAA